MEDAKKQTKAEDLKGSECQGQEQGQDPQETQGTQDIQNTQDPQDQDNQDQGAKDEEPDWKDRYARAMADFDNFRKRTARDREDLVKFAAADVLKDILPTVDNLARALNEATDKEDDPFVAGVKLVYDGLVKALADHGATPLDSVGEPFDANFHEALAQLPSEDVEEGHVMSEVKRGWMLHGKLLRAAQVVVSAGKKA
jgi:molecular chaperone GrpE